MSASDRTDTPMTDGSTLTDDQINRSLQFYSTRVFDLSDIARTILGCIAVNDAQNVSEIGKHTDIYESVIWRNIRGGKETLGLLKEGFVGLEFQVPFLKKKGTMVYYFDITLKGFLASLAKVNCDQTCYFRALVNAISVVNARSVKNAKRRQEKNENARYFLKVAYLIFLAWHYEDRIKLTYAKRLWDTYRLFQPLIVEAFFREKPKFELELMKLVMEQDLKVFQDVRTSGQVWKLVRER